MESTLSSSASSLLALSKTLRSSPSTYPSIFSLLHCRRLSYSNPLLTRSLTTRILTHRLAAAVDVTKSSSARCYCAPIRCASASLSSGGGGGIGGEIGGGGGGGGDGSEGGVPKVTATAADDVSAISPDAIILDVGGMTCGGCASKVKKILENQPQVSSASVNLATETAIVWLKSEAKVVPNWREELGEMLAKHLTNCGFESNLRDPGRENVFQIFERKMDQKRSKLRESGRELAVSWALCAVCMFGHLSHFIWAKASWIHVFHSTGFHLSMSLFTLLGPGRQLIVDGLKSFFRGAPNMNTLVGLGALSSFTVSSLAAFIPKLVKLEILSFHQYEICAKAMPLLK